ncbi:VOC family protein [Coralliovum pocilloporae]|uniref:VOC family protein n=1 Tax=Coralliovum pocilloporae TaxID=3066369 RepID=UPI0033077CF8
MTIGHFLWTDLSTYDLEAAQADYAQLFSWTFQRDGDYAFATLRGQEVAALFPMPPQLAKINMPSFWMSYVHVDDLEATVAKARLHDGVIIEVEPQAFSSDARIALVRDPSGAGFTLYEGPDITPQLHGPGSVEGRYHHVPSLDLIEPFYNDLFGWTFTRSAEQPWTVHDIRHPDGSVIAQVEEVPETIRGKYRYWMPCFTVRSTEETLTRLRARDGELSVDLTDGRLLVTDRQGAHFMVRPTGQSTPDKEENVRQAEPGKTGDIAWKALIGLAIIWLAALFDLQFIWGILFILWARPALTSGYIDLFEPVDRQARPVLYWAIMGTWLFFGVWLMLSPLLDTMISSSS